MSGHRLRNLLLLVLAGGVGYWIYHDRPTLPGLIDRITGPLFQSKAAVNESEHKRVMGEAAPAVGRGDEDVTVGRIQEGMKSAEVRGLLGWPDQIEEFRVNRKPRIRWTYRRAGRTVVFEDGRVISIVVR